MHLISICVVALCAFTAFTLATVDAAGGETASAFLTPVHRRINESAQRKHVHFKFLGALFRSFTNIMPSLTTFMSPIANVVGKVAPVLKSFAGTGLNLAKEYVPKVLRSVEHIVAAVSDQSNKALDEEMHRVQDGATQAIETHIPTVKIQTQELKKKGFEYLLVECNKFSEPLNELAADIFHQARNSALKLIGDGTFSHSRAASYLPIEDISDSFRQPMIQYAQELQQCAKEVEYKVCGQRALNTLTNQLEAITVKSSVGMMNGTNNLNKKVNPTFSVTADHEQNADNEVVKLVGDYKHCVAEVTKEYLKSRSRERRSTSQARKRLSATDNEFYDKLTTIMEHTLDRIDGMINK